MKNILFLTFLVILPLFYINDDVNAQNRGTGSITGVVLEKSDNTVIEGAAITLRRVNDSTAIVKGTQTNASGQFTLEQVPFGRYRMNVTLVGYSTAVLTGVVVNADDPSVTLDTIKLKEGGTTTDEIEVTAERGPLSIEPDKKVFNVTQDLVNQSGSAIDLLRNVPSVSVDVDGNVSLRGSENVKILIDGRPAGLDGANRTQMLEQMPANSIQTIELITNPSAKYQAEGNSGIINIVTKRNRVQQSGYNGNITLGAGTSDKYNGGFVLNLKNEKFALSTNYSFRLFNMKMGGTNLRENYLNGTTSYIDQLSDAANKMNGHFGKVSLDYFINPMHVITLSSGIRYRTHNRNESTTNSIWDAQRILTSSSVTKNNSTDKGYDLDFSLAYFGKFKNPKQTLAGEISYDRDKDDEDLSLNSSAYDETGTLIDNVFLQNTKNKGTSDDFTARLDYVQPLGENSKLEVGVRGDYRKNDDDFTSEHFDYTQNAWVPDININNHFIYKEQIYAGYSIFQSKIGNFGYQLGLRVEHTKSNGDLVTTGQNFDKNYTSFFPTINLSQQLSKSDEIQLGYTRRIHRPRLRFLNPFTDYSDPYNLRTGNPNLKPEYIDSYELSYVKYLGQTTITPSVFVRNTHDAITRTYTLLDSNTSLSTFDNIATQLAYGTELIAVSQLTPWLNLNGTVSYFKVELRDNNSNITNSNYTWMGRLMSTIKLPEGFNIQLSYNYMGENVTTQGSSKPIQFLDAALKKDLFDGRASVNLRVSDIFKTMNFDVALSGSNFSQSFKRSRDSRTAFLTFTYNFGTQDKQNQRRNKDRDNGEEEQPDFDY
ncbi:MAG: TonB-dependent receptor [Ignavibacteriae bacterium]|nr:MAG: TonB-dependent receptor [Ignavibacteriota bacterium]